ncbi:MAG: AraC family transcriptional regulator [Collimonas sp.]|uniref:AraC family transcriptional regulator n=1 Tax=Collimonas sp. TaxID=1963772 RepID=UPI0032661E0C
MHSQSLSLAPLYRRHVFQSSKKVDCHVQVARELSAHDLYWKGDNVDTVLFKATIRQMQVFMLKYGAEVVVRPKLFDGFVLVHMTLNGIAEIESDGQKICIPQGRAAVISPKKNLRLWWQAGSEQLILKIPASLFDMIGAPDATGIACIPSLFLLPEQMSPHWELLMQSLLGVLGLAAQSEQHAVWINHFEQGAVQFLWSQLTATSLIIPETAETLSSENVTGAGKFKRLDALERYIQERLCDPLSLADLARVAGVSVRGLNALCHQHHGVTPMDMLRNIRLDAARRQLLSQPSANITEIAFALGFAHLGRFSAYYRQRFGELPKQTRSCHH